MSRSAAWFTHAANLLVGGTGLVYGWMHYFLEPADEFAVVNHPLQPDLQHLHVVTAPLLVFACGLIWTEHVWRRFRSGHLPRRASGLLLLLLVPPMIASGYLLQVAESEAWRGAWIVVHVATSCLWIGGTVAHQLTRRADPRPG